MSETCRTCVHWTPRVDFRSAIEPEYETRLPTGQILRAETWEEAQEQDRLYRACHGVPMGPVGTRSQTTPGAVVIDGSQYYAELLTTADFGCILHRPAE